MVDDVWDLDQVIATATRYRRLSRSTAGEWRYVGAFARFAAFWGAIQMILFWMSHLEGGLLAGLPIEHGWFVSSHNVYALLLFGLGAIGTGRILGVDQYLEQTAVVQNNEWLRYLLG